VVAGLSRLRYNPPLLKPFLKGIAMAGPQYVYVMKVFN
jgi:hypothetical protein